MPRYDYRCAGGHVEEVVADRDASSLPCPACGRDAVRIISTAPVVNGFARRPTREAPIRLTDALTALDDVQHAARRAGVEPPDLYAEAQRRVASGEVAAIE